MDCPSRLQELTPEWLSALLGARVRAVECEEIGQFSNLVWRLHLDYAAHESRAPRSLVAKLPRETRRDLHGQDLAHEIRFYRELGGRLRVRTPRFWFGDPDPARTLLLMEDITDLQPIHFVRGAELAHAERAMDALARLHAEHRGAAANQRWLPAFADPVWRAERAKRYDEDWSRKRGFFADAAPAFVPLGDALAGRIGATLEPLGTAQTLLHGDAHFENLALAGEPPDVLFHDWAAVVRGHASIDVATFLVMSFPVKRRRELERDLVARHAAALADRESVLADPWEAYRAGVLHWAIRMVAFTDPAAVEPMQAAGRDMIVRRCTAAAADLQVTDCVR